MDKPRCRTCGQRHTTGPCGQRVLGMLGPATTLYPEEVNKPAKPVTNTVTNGADVTNTVTNKLSEHRASVTNSAARQARWRAANRERYNAYQRDYMKERRGGQTG